MKKSILFFSFIITIICIYGLFQVKYNVKNMKKDLVELQRQIASDKESLRVLKAEWAFLNNPDRIEKLAEQYLGIKYVKASQIKDSEKINSIFLTNHVASAKSIRPILKPSL